MSTMNKQIHDQKNGLTYMLCGDCYLPDLNLSNADKTPLGRYGRMRMNISGSIVPDYTLV